jgi:type I restriction enzyme R subunit
MKGRGVRTLSVDELRGVTPDAEAKQRFVIVDAVGVTDHPQIESRPLERQPHVPLHKLLEAVALGSTDVDLVSSLASRLARLDRRMSQPEAEAVRDAAHGVELSAIIHGLVDALDPDRHEEIARQETGLAEPPPEAIASAPAAPSPMPSSPSGPTPRCARLSPPSRNRMSRSSIPSAATK